MLTTESGKEENCSEDDVVIENTINIPLLGKEYDSDVEFMDNRKAGTLNLYKMKCSCPEFKLKEDYPLGDLKRMCSHLRGEYCKTPFFKSLSNLDKALLKNGYGNKDNIHVCRLSKEYSFAITYNNNDEYGDWFNVVAPKANGQCVCYNFNPNANYWGKGRHPELFKDEIEGLVRTVFIFKN